MSKSLFELGLQWSHENAIRAPFKEECLALQKSPEMIDVKRKKKHIKRQGQKMTPT